MITLEVENINQINKAFSDLRAMGIAKKGDISKIYRKATKPLVASTRSLIPARRNKTTYSRYSTRTHRPGALKRSIKFVASRHYKLVYYVGSKDNKAGFTKTGKLRDDVYYKHMYAYGTKGSVVGSKSGGAAYINGSWVSKGTKIRGQRPHHFMRMGFAISKNRVTHGLNRGLGELQDRIWGGKN